MMRDKYLAYVDAEDIITQMFWDSMHDHHKKDNEVFSLNALSVDEIRCGITVFCNDIKNYLIDHYNVDQDENERGE